MEDKIKNVLENKVNPLLGDHFGGCELHSYEDGVVYIKMMGACSGCPSAQLTLEEVIKSELMNAIPELKDVKLDTSISSELLDMAKKY